MKMRVVDQVTDRGQRVNEDLFGLEDGLAWMLDGATQIGEALLSEEGSDARWLAHAFDRYLRLLAQDSVRQSLSDVVVKAIHGVAKEAAAAKARWSSIPPSCTCGIVVLLDNKLEYFVLGDVTLAVRDEEGGTKVVTDSRLQEFDRDALDALVELQKEGLTFRDARRRVDPIVRRNRGRMNKPDGYWVLGMDSDAALHAVTGSLKVESGSTLLLATDGFARAVDLFRLYQSWDQLVDAVDRHSLSRILEDLRAAEDEDSECTRFPRLAPKDDATAAVLRIEGSRAGAVRV